MSNTRPAETAARVLSVGLDKCRRLQGRAQQAAPPHRSQLRKFRQHFHDVALSVVDWASAEIIPADAGKLDDLRPLPGFSDEPALAPQSSASAQAELDQLRRTTGSVSPSLMCLSVAMISAAFCRRRR